jgi:hypothetical protein
MAESASPPLMAWSSFYIMTGSAAATLTGLMFVVITLVGRTEAGKNPEGISTFSTPTVMYFATALLVSAILTAPWHHLLYPGLSVAVIGLYGVVYILRIFGRTRRFSAYTADAEDWTWYIILPFIAYGVISAGSIALEFDPLKALFAVGGGIVLLILIGIHNSWDVVTYITIGGPPPQS